MESALATIAALPKEKRADALLACFSTMVDAMDANSVREKRDQLMARFSHCGASFETCQLVIKWLDCQLAQRDRTGARMAR